jgi:aminoglycoside phosphotransferase (APT) family kinase protein
LELGGLTSWMDARGLGAGPVEGVQRLGGGTQNILIRFERGDRSFVLRRPPESARPEAGEVMVREATVLRALAGSDIPHPTLIALCEDAGLLGAAFYLMEPVAGFNAVSGLPPLHAADPALRRRMGLALAEAAARIGNLDHHAAGLEGFGKPEGFIERQAPRWAAQLAKYAALQGWPGPAALAGIDEIGVWLTERRPAGFAPGLMHGDFHIANVMYRMEDAEVAAVVDWELATIGAPLMDLGWLLATWPDPDGRSGAMEVAPWDGFPTAEALVEAYAAVSRHDLADLAWWRVMACYKLAILLEGGFARACAGLAPKDVGERLHGRSVRLVERALTWMAQ